MEEKIEVRMPTGLKRAAEVAAQQDGDGNVGAWVRALIRSKVKELGIPVEAVAAPPATKARKKKETSR